MRKRGLPLGLVILRYFAYVLAAALALALGTYVAFGVLVGTGAVYPANHGDTALAETSARLAELPARTTWGPSTPPCRRASGGPCSRPTAPTWPATRPSGRGTMLREAAFDGLAVEYGALSSTRYDPVELADGSVCVLTYEYMPQFTSKGLRDALPNPQNLLLGAFAVLAVLVLAGIAARAARVLSRKMAPLADAARRIEEHDLDFEVGTSGVREIDDMLGAMDEMRASLKRSLEAQWRGEQAQRDQIAALAHDLKTPLTVVRGNVDLLVEGELPDEARACAADAAEGARRLDAYLAALIDVATGRRGGVRAGRPPAAAPLLAHLRAQTEALASCAGVQVAWSEGSGLPETLRMDEALVERAVMNVAANAVEHAPVGSTVEVRVRAEAAPADGAGERAGEGGGMLAVSVADAGPGFSPEALAPRMRALLPGRPRPRRARAPRSGAARGRRGGRAPRRIDGAGESREGRRRRSLRDAAVPSILSPWRGVALGRRAPCAAPSARRVRSEPARNVPCRPRASLRARGIRVPFLKRPRGRSRPCGA